MEPAGETVAGTTSTFGLTRRSYTAPSGSAQGIRGRQTAVAASTGDLEHVRTTYSDIKQLTGRLRNVLREGGLGIPSRQIMSLQVRLVECYDQAIVFQDQHRLNGKEWGPDFPYIERIEYNLYKAAFRVVIKYYRNEIASIDGSEGVLKRRVNDAFVQFLNSSIQTFERLLKGYSALGNPNRAAGGVHTMGAHFRILNVLGDLERYKANAAAANFSRGSKSRNRQGKSLQDFGRSSEYYTRAIYLNCNESDINPHNQLASISSKKGERMVTIYHYYRALTTKRPMIAVGVRPGKIISCPLRNLETVEFKQILLRFRKDGKNPHNLQRWGSKSFASCQNMSDNFVYFQALLFETCSNAGHSETVHESQDGIGGGNSYGPINSDLRHSRATVCKQLQMVLSRAAIAPRAITRMLFSAWFAIIHLSADRDKHLLAQNMQRHMDPELLSILRSNAWGMFIDLLQTAGHSYLDACKNGRGSAEDDGEKGSKSGKVNAAARKTQKKRQLRTLSAIISGLDLLSVALSPPPEETIRSYLDGSWPPTMSFPEANFWRDCDAISQRMLWSTVAPLLNIIPTVFNRNVPSADTDRFLKMIEAVAAMTYGDQSQFPRTTEEAELYGFPPLDCKLKMHGNVLPEELRSATLEDPVDIANYRYAKIVRFGEDLLHQQQQFFEKDRAVCCIARGEGIPNSDFASYTVYDILSSDRKKPPSSPLKESPGRADGSSRPAGSDDEAETMNRENESDQSNSQPLSQAMQCEQAQDTPEKALGQGGQGAPQSGDGAWAKASQRGRNERGAHFFSVSPVKNNSPVRLDSGPVGHASVDMHPPLAQGASQSSGSSSSNRSPASSLVAGPVLLLAQYSNSTNLPPLQKQVSGIDCTPPLPSSSSSSAPASDTSPAENGVAGRANAQANPRMVVSTAMTEYDDDDEAAAGGNKPLQHVSQVEDSDIYRIFRDDDFDEDSRQSFVVPGSTMRVPPIYSVGGLGGGTAEVGLEEKALKTHRPPISAVSCFIACGADYDKFESTRFERGRMEFARFPFKTFEEANGGKRVFPGGEEASDSKRRRRG